jgi:hypothetical protein
MKPLSAATAGRQSGGNRYSDYYPRWYSAGACKRSDEHTRNNATQYSWQHKPPGPKKTPAYGSYE